MSSALGIHQIVTVWISFRTVTLFNAIILGVRLVANRLRGNLTGTQAHPI